MDELDPSEIFRQEAAELMEQLELALLDLASTPNDQALIDCAFRALHTIKGSGAMFGFDVVASFIHDFETAFDLIRKGRVQATTDLIKVALDAKDHIRQLIEAPGQVEPGSGEVILARLAKATAGDCAPAPGPKPSTMLTAWHVEMAFDTAILVNGSNPLLMFDEMRALGTCDLIADSSNVPDLRTLDPQALHLTWRADVTMEAPVSAFDEVFMFVRDEMMLEVTAIDAPAAPSSTEPPPMPPTPPATSGPETKSTNPPATSTRPETKSIATAASTSQSVSKEAATIRVPAERLDEMMDRVGELVIVQARLNQIAHRGGNDDVIKSVAEDIARLTSALREAMMGIRMVPIGTLFVRFRRLLHDLSLQLGKEIELVTSGDETEMDKTMIERLADPLVHIIRNAADHGLEAVETRVAAGKSPAGQIRLVARHAGAEVLVSISDDGRGLDARRIRQKAEDQGLVAPGAALSDAEINALIFAPGFSTAQEVSALSGRGVGMDVVKRTIEGMRGAIDVTTAVGQGTTITLRLPLTLAIIEGLLVRVADTKYVIPLTAVEECVELSDLDDARSEGRSFLNIRGDLIPFLRLRELFTERGQPDAFQKIVIVSTGDARVGLVVDQIIGGHQTVIKSLSRLHVDVATFSGATILGDGAVALILDIPHIVSLGQLLEARHKALQMETV